MPQIEPRIVYTRKFIEIDIFGAPRYKKLLFTDTDAVMFM